jgi:trehalose 6-phosphate synthase complex regulatory subunit
MSPSTSVLQTSSSQTTKTVISVRPHAHDLPPQIHPFLLVWVNDYHLMLLPSLLRASSALPSHVPIGFFMHVAFPSSEIFRCLSVRQALLHGLLAADLVGFQTASYARHFRQTVSRILAYEALPKGIQVEGGTGSGRFVDVGVFPMGIDVSALKEKR